MKRSDGDLFLAWPGWAHGLRTLLLCLLVTIWFVLIYGGADWFTAGHRWRIRIHFDVELSLPLIPAFTSVYMSIYLLFLAAPFVLRRREEVTALAMKLIAAIAIAGVAFLAIPARLAYPVPKDLGMWEGLFQFADRLNLDYNLVPSLHVALSVICIEAYAAHAPQAGRFALRLWGLLIAASTLFTHQHHAVDLVTGYGLALSVNSVNWVSLWCRNRGPLTNLESVQPNDGG
jgi:membrane-associated phospholipid phosphatase